MISAPRGLFSVPAQEPNVVSTKMFKHDPLNSRWFHALSGDAGVVNEILKSICLDRVAYPEVNSTPWEGGILDRPG